MKLIMEGWRKYLTEETTAPKKVIFMAGAPGVGKSYVREKLGLDKLPQFQHEVKDKKTGKKRMELNVVDPDKIYVPLLKKELPPLGVPEEEAANVEKLTLEYVRVRRALKELLSQILNSTEPEEGWKSEEIENKYDEAHERLEDNSDVAVKLDAAKREYDSKRNICQVQGQCFASGQKQAKSQQEEWFQQDLSIIIDGTAGYYSRILNQKQAFEQAGYDVAMIFVDAPLETAVASDKDRERKLGARTIEKSMKSLLGGTYYDSKKGEEVTKPNIMKPFVDRFGREQQGYEKEFGDNYFYVINDRAQTDKSIAAIKPQFQRFLSGQELNEADWQKYVESNYSRWMTTLTRQGGNQNSGPYKKKAPINYRGSAPPGTVGG
jgi:hypothetical protein|tara:strand:- start:2503 stop:3636 length:1134 start_codon:yes stop_codon:yes gene_type:complete